MADVGNVRCPECDRVWTGMFDKSVDEAVCKDCMKERGISFKGHPEVNISQGKY